MVEPHRLGPKDRIALLRPGIDAHTLGLSAISQLLDDCFVGNVMAQAQVCAWLEEPEAPVAAEGIRNWLVTERITVIGYSYRLDPASGVELLERLVRVLKKKRLFAVDAGPIRGLYFAGLPKACEMVKSRIPEVFGVLTGDESPTDALRILGVPAESIPETLCESSRYDDLRLSFGKDLVRKGDYLGVKPVDRSGYPGFGGWEDSLVKRLAHGEAHELPPLMRAHVGPFLPDRLEAVRLFGDWTRRLAKGGFLDILSIGGSQLTQSRFGEDWGDAPNGGGVPLNSEAELAAVYRDARPMLVRAYAGTRGIPNLARIHEKQLNMAWHALSLWWFCKSDGRGPNTVMENLREHCEAMRVIAASGKPLEPNVSHHFAFRGADDVTYIAAAVLAARAVRRHGVKTFILQNMLNTPRATWGVQDLAKSRVLLKLVRELEGPDFRVILQPRGGLDYFSADAARAKAQLAAVSALMDDIEADRPQSPPVIHVVSYSEGTALADPGVVEESIQITRHALAQWRGMKARGEVEDMGRSREVAERAETLLEETRTLLQAMERAVPNLDAPEGLYRAMADGFLPVPWLWECRDEFSRAVAWKTRLVKGGVKLVDASGRVMTMAERLRNIMVGMGAA